jgi:TolB-like protein
MRVQYAYRGSESRENTGIAPEFSRDHSRNEGNMPIRVSFGPFRFEPPSGRLWSGEQEIKLTPKAAALLATLLARAGQPVSKDALFAAVWPNTVVSDDALASCIQELRRALSDDPREPRYIETRHRRGYQFIAELKSVDDPATPPSQATASTRGKPTVAVLPFDNISGVADQDYFADGITEDIITALSRHRSLLVLSRGSTFAFKGRGIDVRQIGAQLGADYVVEGSVGKAGRLVRITARLVETEAGRCVWAEQYDRELTDVFDVQDDIVATIAARIEPEVGSAERTRVEGKSPQALRAWDFFHLGTKFFYRFTPDDNREAQQLFRRAIELDPALAQAYGWLSFAMVSAMIYFDADLRKEDLDEAVGIARKAVELMCGRALLANKAYRDSLAELESAVELNPNLAVVYCGLGDSLAYEGRFAEAIPYFEKAINLSPYDPQRWAFFSYRALAHLLAGEFEQALEWAQKATRVPNCHYWPFAHRVAALGHLQRESELPGAIADLLERKPEFSCAYARERLFYLKDPLHLERYLEGLRKAGLQD